MGNVERAVMEGTYDGKPWRVEYIKAEDYDALRRVAEKLTTAVRIWANHPDRGFPRHLSEEAQVMIEVLASAEAVLANVALRQADADYEAGGFSKIN